MLKSIINKLGEETKTSEVPTKVADKKVSSQQKTGFNNQASQNNSWRSNAPQQNNYYQQNYKQNYQQNYQQNNYSQSIQRNPVQQGNIQYQSTPVSEVERQYVPSNYILQ